jgi:hypothetical protein
LRAGLRGDDNPGAYFLLYDTADSGLYSGFMGDLSIREMVVRMRSDQGISQQLDRAAKYHSDPEKKRELFQLATDINQANFNMFDNCTLDNLTHLNGLVARAYRLLELLPPMNKIKLQSEERTA